MNIVCMCVIPINKVRKKGYLINDNVGDLQPYGIETSENTTRVDKFQSVDVCHTNSNKCTRTLLQVYMARDLVFLPSQNLGLTA
jgi:hypothetical protein